MTMTMAPVAFDTEHEDLIVRRDGRRFTGGSTMRSWTTTGSDWRRRRRTARCGSSKWSRTSQRGCSARSQGTPTSHQDTKPLTYRHEGPVWQVAWAHPKFGALLASCSYDGRVIVWKETASGWIRAKEHKGHDSSVNSVAWAPHEFGLCLACASSDGKVSVLTYRVEEAVWQVDEWSAHQIGCNAVSWCPSARPASLISALGGAGAAAGASAPPSLATKRLATGGCNNLVKIWRYPFVHGRR